MPFRSGICPLQWQRLLYVGWGTCLVWELPFSISQGMVIVPYLYIGHLIKNTAAGAPDPQMAGGRYPGQYIGSGAGRLGCRQHRLHLSRWTLGPLEHLLDGAVGCGLVLVFLRWNRGRGPIVTGLEAVGRRSLQIFCVHTVELTAIPWYLFAQQFEGGPSRACWRSTSCRWLPSG